MAIRILSSESISGNITIHSPSNAPYIDFVENADTGDSKARITMDQIDTNNGTLIFATENAGTLTTALTISQSQNATFAGNVTLSGQAAPQLFLDSNTGGTPNYTLIANASSQFIIGRAGVSNDFILDSGNATFAGDVHLSDTILGLRSTNDYAIQYRDLDFRFIGSADGTTQRKFSFGYYTSDNPAGTWNGKVYINSYSGDVGIGTASPDCKLTVADSGSGGVNPSTISSNTVATFRRTGGVSHNANISILAGTSGASILNFGDRDNEDAGIITYTHDSGGSDTMAFTVGTSEKMRIINSGNVGIGTVSPQANLHINEDTSNSYGILRLEGANRGGIIEMYNQTSYPVSSWTTDQSGNIFFATSGAFAATSLSTKFTILTGGNVGIGTTSPSATEPTGGRLPTGWTRANSRALEIAAPDFANSGLFLRNSGTTATGTDITGDQYFGDTYIDNRFNSDNGSIYFRTKTAVSPQIRMAIKGNGNVGIGVESPDAKLHINGFTAGQGVRIQYGNSSGTIQAVNFIANGGNNGVIGMQMVSAGVGDLWLGGSGGRSLTLYRDGNVGIGVESPDAKLQVNGSISSGTGTAPTQIIYDSNGNVRAFTHNFSEEKSTPSARSVTFVDVSGVGNFHQAFFYVQYGTRLQGVSDATTGVVIRTYGVNRFNGGTLQVTETNAIAGSSNSLAHALVSVAIVSNTQYRLIINFSSTLGASSFASGEIKGYGVGDTFPTITFAEGAAG